LLIFDELSNSKSKEASVDIHGISEIIKETVTHNEIGSLYTTQEREGKLNQISLNIELNRILSGICQETKDECNFLEWLNIYSEE